MNKPLSNILSFQNCSQYNVDSAFSFTGKERDEETGYSYFGARYYDADLLTGWLNVDPMSDKYPSISPYAYCAWNPVMLVDPEGRDGRIIIGEREGKKTITIPTTIYVKGGENWNAPPNELKTIVDDLNHEALKYKRKKEVDGCIVAFDINFKVWSEGIEMQEGDNTMTLMNYTKRSATNGQVITDNTGVFIERLSGNNANINSPDIYTTGLNRHVNRHACMHEVFHLLGLKDRYTEPNISDKGYERNIMGGNAAYTWKLSEEQNRAYTNKYSSKENGTYIQKTSIE